MKELKNVKSYKNIKEDLNLAQWPYPSSQLVSSQVREQVAELLTYGGVGELKVPGTFLSIVPQVINLPVAEVAELLSMSKSTYYRAREEGILDMDTIDKLSSLFKLYQRGLEVFEDQEDFEDWLKTKIISLGGKKPISLLKTENGRAAVSDTLGRIEHGVYG